MAKHDGETQPPGKTKKARVSLGKTLRFEIFKRDAFTCQYCGATPPSVVLEVDHVIPVAQGGSNDEHNLVTSCFECNRGKRDRHLHAIPESVTERSHRAQELEDQAREYEKVLKAKKRRINRAINGVEGVFREEFPGYSFTPSFRKSVHRFLDYLPAIQVSEAMELAIYRVGQKGADNVAKYFCGICWKTIRDQGIDA